MSTLKTSTWNIRLTLPAGDPKGKPGWQTNIAITCVCDTIEKAIALVRAEHPAGMIYGATHKGTEHTLFDPDVATPSSGEGGA